MYRSNQYQFNQNLGLKIHERILTLPPGDKDAVPQRGQLMALSLPKGIGAVQDAPADGAKSKDCLKPADSMAYFGASKHVITHGQC